MTPDVSIGPTADDAFAISRKQKAIGLRMRRPRYVQNLSATSWFIHIRPDPDPILSGRAEYSVNTAEKRANLSILLTLCNFFFTWEMQRLEWRLYDRWTAWLNQKWEYPSQK